MTANAAPIPADRPGPDAPALLLDIDDVLITDRQTAALGKKDRYWRIRVDSGLKAKLMWSFDPEAVLALRHVVETVNPWVVVSSTWREYGPGLVGSLFSRNRCIDLLTGRIHQHWCTPLLPLEKLTRRDEITRWMEHNRETRAIAIDNDESISGQPWAVLVDPATGLTMADAERAVQLLQAATPLSTPRPRGPF